MLPLTVVVRLLHSGCASTLSCSALADRHPPFVMEGSNKSRTMSETKLRSKTTSSVGTSASRSALTSTARMNIAPLSGSRSSSKSRSAGKVPMGRLLSVPEKRELGIISDDRDDDDDDDPSRRKPRRKPPARPPPRKDDSAGNAPPFGVPKSRILELEQVMREELRRVHTAARSSKVHLTEAFEEMDELGIGMVSHKDFQRVGHCEDLTAEDGGDVQVQRWWPRAKAVPYENFIKRMVRGAARQSRRSLCAGYRWLARFQGRSYTPLCKGSTLSDFDARGLIHASSRGKLELGCTATTG